MGNLLYRQVVNGNSLLPQVLTALYEMKVQSVLVEGGAQLLQSFINEGLWDEARVITNRELVITDGIASPELKRQTKATATILFSDTIQYYYNSDGSL